MLRCSQLLLRFRTAFVVLALPFVTLGALEAAHAQQTDQGQSSPAAAAPDPAKAPKTKSASPAKPTPEEELQRSIDNAGSDRAALVRNLEAYLAKYPESPQRAQIYRALVEADLQLQDNLHATVYAERIVALAPEDMSMTLLTIQLLERNGDEAALKRATSYATRVIEFVRLDSADRRSPRVSLEEWQTEHRRDEMSLLMLRGRLYMKLHQSDYAQRDFATSYALLPNTQAAEKLGEIAEMNKDAASAMREYARAFALSGDGKGESTRRAIRTKLGNVWRQAHGSDAGLGDFLLQTSDEVSNSTRQPVERRNAHAKTTFDFTLRKADSGAPFPLLPLKGKVVVVNFWATWCGPCRALAPLLEHVRQAFQGNDGVQFLGANCDEDESLVAPFLAEDHPKMTMVFADGLERIFSIDSFPTVVVLDREGKIVYRSEGFGDDDFEKNLTDAIQRAAATSPAATPSPSSSGF